MKPLPFFKFWSASVCYYPVLMVPAFVFQGLEGVHQRMPCSEALCQRHKSGGAGMPRLALQVLHSIMHFFFWSCCMTVHKNLAHPPFLLVSTTELLMLLPFLLGVSILLGMFTYNQPLQFCYKYRI
jgi:hypothetical protein